MDERLVTELEAAIADAGALLVRAQKYRRGTGEEGTTLLRDALALGDAARRLHRHAALDADAARGLLADAQALVARVHAFLRSVRDEPAFRTAVAAHAAGDQAALAATLPQIFSGLVPVATPPDLYHVVPWRRRGRLRPAADLAADVARLLAEGIAAEGDDLSPGVDTALPAVVLEAAPPTGEPVMLRLAAGTIPVPAYRLQDTGEYLFYVAGLRAPATVLVAPELDADVLEDTPVDYPRYRAQLVDALAAARVPPQ